jgi:Na+/H+-translocating membrane pyrophosphatase
MEEHTKQQHIAHHIVSYLYLYPAKLQKHPRGNDLMNKISDQIKSGSKAFLKTEYYYLSLFCLGVAVVLLILYSLDSPSLSSQESGKKTDGVRYASSFLIGAFLSAASGYAGMMVATDANVRTTQAASDQGLSVALRVAFTGGAVMGFTVVGLGLLGLSLMFYLMTLGNSGSPQAVRMADAADTIAAFGFGASSIALFARVAGGIYTKAADVGADLVGKIEMGTYRLCSIFALYDESS